MDQSYIPFVTQADGTSAEPDVYTNGSESQRSRPYNDPLPAKAAVNLASIRPNDTATRVKWRSGYDFLLGWLQVRTSDNEDIKPGGLVLLKHCATIDEIYVTIYQIRGAVFRRDMPSDSEVQVQVTYPRWNVSLERRLVTEVMPTTNGLQPFWEAIIQHQRLPGAQQPDLYPCQDFENIPRIEVVIDKSYIELSSTMTRGPKNSEFYTKFRRHDRLRHEYGIPSVLVQKIVEEDIARVMAVNKRLQSDLGHIKDLNTVNCITIRCLEDSVHTNAQRIKELEDEIASSTKKVESASKLYATLHDVTDIFAQSLADRNAKIREHQSTIA